MTDSADAIVIGGGVTGCSIAYHLARLGAGQVVGRIHALQVDRTALQPGAIAAALGLDSGVVRQRKLRATRKIAERLSQLAVGVPHSEQGKSRDDM